MSSSPSHLSPSRFHSLSRSPPTPSLAQPRRLREVRGERPLLLLPRRREAGTSSSSGCARRAPPPPSTAATRIWRMGREAVASSTRASSAVRGLEDNTEGARAASRRGEAERDLAKAARGSAARHLHERSPGSTMHGAANGGGSSRGASS